MPKVRIHQPALLSRRARLSGAAVGKLHCRGGFLPKVLLTIAKGLIEQGHFNIAIVTSLMACEVAAERAFDSIYVAKKLESLGEAVEGLMNGHNLANDKHRKLWNALTGTSLENEPFWSQFQSSSKKRNSIIHGSGHANKVEAEAALRASTDFITHLKQM